LGRFIGVVNCGYCCRIGEREDPSKLWRCTRELNRKVRRRLKWARVALCNGDNSGVAQRVLFLEVMGVTAGGAWSERVGQTVSTVCGIGVRRLGPDVWDDGPGRALDRPFRHYVPGVGW